MWGADYPHAEGTFRGSKALIANLLRALIQKFEELNDRPMVNMYKTMQDEFQRGGTIAQEMLNRSLAASSRAFQWSSAVASSRAARRVPRGGVPSVVVLVAGVIIVLNYGLLYTGSVFVLSACYAIVTAGMAVQIGFSQQIAFSQSVFFGVGALFLAMLTVLLVTATIVLLVPEEYRAWVTLGFAVLYLLGTVAAIIVLKGLLKRAPFSESLDQFKKDTELLDAFK